MYGLNPFDFRALLFPDDPMKLWLDVQVSIPLISGRCCFLRELWLKT